MCDRLRCEKTGQPINPDCHDCLIPSDGPTPEMFRRGYSDRCANCASIKDNGKTCGMDNSKTEPNLYCEDWREK